MKDSQNPVETLRQEVETLHRELQKCTERLNEAEETLQAIRSGEIDAVVVSTQQGARVFTLKGADYIYQCLVEQMSEGAATISAEGMILYCNQRLSELLNYPAKTLIGSRLETFVSPHDRKAFLLLLQQLQEHKTLTQELSLITATENQEVPVKLSLKQFKIDEFLVNSIIITDITESKLKEATKLNQILNSAIAVISSYRAFPDHTWVFDYWSQGCEIILGYTAEELMADQNLWSSRVPPEDLETIVAETFEDYRLKRSSNVEYRFRHKDGTLRQIESSQFFEWDETNNCWLGTGILTDITEIKLSEIALREAETTIKQQEEQLRLALELTQTGIWDWNISTGVIYWNDSHYALFGYQLGEVESSYQAWYNRVHPDDVTEVEQKLLQALENQTDFAAEYRVIYSDGTIHWVLGKGRGLYDEAGQPLRMIGTIIDITERKLSEIALSEAEEALSIAIEAAQMGTWYLDLIHDVVSKRSLRHDQLFGYETPPVEWGQAIARQHIVEADREIFDAALLHARETGNLNFEVRVQWPDGNIHWMAARGHFYFDDQGNPVSGGGVNF
ncbi:MAG TPA: hypothetical protein DDZ60_02585, partial [Planktothrix sp. UBA10369]|nr:hypothetical protein [Planktothrix sp. UBA10369]